MQNHRYSRGERVEIPAPQFARDKRNIPGREYYGIVRQIHHDLQPSGSHTVDVETDMGGMIGMFEGELVPTRPRQSCMCPYCMTHDAS